jgi:6-phosphogluconolactonase
MKDYMTQLSLTVMALLAVSGLAAAASQEIVFVGSGKKDIEAFRFDPATGALASLGRAAAIAHPSFLAVAPNHHFLYAISEGHGPNDSGVSAFSIDAVTGKLTLLNSQPAGGGAGPCHVEVDASGKNVLIANYGSGSVAVFPLNANGALGPVSAFVQDSGSSVNPERQEGPHAHCIVTDPADRFAFVCDLGLDKVMVFKFDSSNGTLTPATPAFVPVSPGAGPRHIAFHPNGKLAYVINEMASSITAFAYDAGRGALREIQTESTLPKDFSGRNTDAEIAVHPSGKFVYGSNRGDDSIAVFACDPSTGRLTFTERVSTGGKTPRHFEIDPTGGWLLAANQDSDTVVVFRVDGTTGRLQPVGAPVPSNNPMCVKFLPSEL